MNRDSRTEAQLKDLFSRLGDVVDDEGLKHALARALTRAGYGKAPEPKPDTILIVDNGEEYADHSVFFVRVPGELDPQDVVKAVHPEGALNPSPSGYTVVGRALKINDEPLRGVAVWSLGTLALRLLDGNASLDAVKRWAFAVEVLQRDWLQRRSEDVEWLETSCPERNRDNARRYQTRAHQQRMGMILLMRQYRSAS